MELNTQTQGGGGGGGTESHTLAVGTHAHTQPHVNHSNQELSLVLGKHLLAQTGGD